jgi:phosphatidylglycerophosphate synthase
VVLIPCQGDASCARMQIFPIFCGTLRFMIVFTRCLRQSKQVHTAPSYGSKINLIFIFPSMSSSSYLFFTLGFPQGTLYIFLFVFMRVTCSTNPTLLFKKFLIYMKHLSICVDVNKYFDYQSEAISISECRTVG